MKKNLHFQFVVRRLVSLVTAAFTFTAVSAQTDVIDGWLPGGDSIVLDFSMSNPYISDTNYFYIGRSSIDSLWQSGPTNKPFFSSGFTGRGMMTDTAQSYPANANSAFYIKTDSIYDLNFIVSFRHKYQTDSGKAGGIVEFSTDSGQTWHNVVGDCILMGEMRTTKMYDFDDTLWTGEPAFTGNSGGWVYSRFQFFRGFPIRRTAGPDCLAPNPLIRFRFVSDATSNTLDGWLIDSIKLEADRYGGNVAAIGHANKLEVYPNPSANGVFNFPDLKDSKNYQLEVYDITGKQLAHMPYINRLDISAYSRGMYIYKVKGADIVYTGQLLLQ